MFIGGVGASAAYVAQRPTVARGDVIAADLVSQNRLRGWQTMHCDDAIPIGVKGAKFNCGLVLDDGDQAQIEITLDRAGSFQMQVLSETGPQHQHVPKSGDRWGE